MLMATTTLTSASTIPASSSTSIAKLLQENAQGMMQPQSAQVPPYRNDGSFVLCPTLTQQDSTLTLLSNAHAAPMQSPQGSPEPQSPLRNPSLSPLRNPSLQYSPQSSSSTTPSFSPANTTRKTSQQKQPSAVPGLKLNCPTLRSPSRSPILRAASRSPITSPRAAASRSPIASPGPSASRSPMASPRNRGRDCSPRHQRCIVSTPCGARDLAVTIDGVYVPDPKDWLDTLLSWSHKSLNPEIRQQLETGSFQKV
jgi:hypothetical protein